MNFHILLTLPESFPSEAIDKITKDIIHKDLKFALKKKPSEPMASFEWAIPGAIAIFLANSYFGSFLKEAGKDHYIILKKWLKKTAKVSRLIEITTITSTGSIKKIDKSNSQSKAISIHIETKNKSQIKLLFDLNLDDIIWEQNIEQMLNWVMDHYENYPNDELTMAINKLKSVNTDYLYAIINPKTKKWELLDNIRLGKRMMKKNLDT